MTLLFSSNITWETEKLVSLRQQEMYGEKSRKKNTAKDLTWKGNGDVKFSRLEISPCCQGKME